MGIAPSHVDDPETTTTTTGESKTNDNNNNKNTTIDGIIGVLPSLGEVPGELECAICAEVLLFFPRVFFVSNLRVLLLPCIFTRARRGGGGGGRRRLTRVCRARARLLPTPLTSLLLSPIRAILAMMQKQPKERPVYAGCRVHSFCEVCLKQWVSKFPMKTMAPCPVCREKFSALSSRKFKVDEQCEKKLCAFVVDACPCKMAFRLSEYREHVATCAAHKELREAAAKAMEEARRREEERTKSAAVAAATSSTQISTNRTTNVSYACPLCEDGFGHTFSSVEGFTRHVITEHGSSRASAVCPICAAMPWGRPDYVCQNIVAHVSLRHRFAYEDFTTNVEEEERDFQHALDMSAAIELGNESPIPTSSDDDDSGEDGNNNEEESDDGEVGNGHEDSVTFYARVRSF